MNKNPVDWAAASRAPDPCLVCGSLAKEPLYPSTYIGSVAEAPAYFLAHRSATAHAPICSAWIAASYSRARALRRRTMTRSTRRYGYPPSLDPPFEAGKGHQISTARDDRAGFDPREAVFSIWLR